MKIMRDETFGPVLPVMTFKTEDEAVKLANDSVFGLTASVWTRDIARGRRMAERIDAGTVMVNEVVYTHGIAQTPWGGVKESGYGRTHGRAGLAGTGPPAAHSRQPPFVSAGSLVVSLQSQRGADSLAAWPTTSPPAQS